MSDRDRYIPGVPCWVDTSQPDPEAAVEFYGALFGWELENKMPAEADGKYFIGQIDGKDAAAISSPPADQPPHATWNTYIWVESADETAAKVREAGGKILDEPFDVMEAGRMAVFADREGAVFCGWEAKAHRGAGVVNEAGALVFNDLNTRDVAAAKEFYGAVFGWDVLEMEGGFQSWVLPGYGEFLDELNPGTVERMATMGAPKGFENVVASIVPIPADQPEMPPHWGVTFATEDADATAAKAQELGGTVLAGPFDAPWVRMAVIADPAGGIFTASQFVPENKDLEV
jgi:uncharacterized protein